jgi:hypothetical protein
MLGGYDDAGRRRVLETESSLAAQALRCEVASRKVASTDQVVKYRARTAFVKPDGVLPRIARKSRAPQKTNGGISPDLMPKFPKGTIVSRAPRVLATGPARRRTAPRPRLIIA